MTRRIYIETSVVSYLTSRQSNNVIKSACQQITKSWWERGIKVLNFPHFAQNFQQRAIFQLRSDEEPKYFELHPKHKPYAPKAQKMRYHVIVALKSVVGLTTR